MADVFVGDNDHGDTPLPPLSDLLWAEVTKLRQDKVRLEEDIVHFANELNEVTHQRDEARRNLCYAEVNGQYARRYTPQEYAKLKGWDCFKNDTLSQEVSQEGSKLPATISSNGIRITEYIPPQNSVLEIHPYGAYTTGESTLSVPAIKETT
jgi:hypothetical protein